MAAATSLNLWGILSESKRIINAHSRHFLALSVIFLLPLSFSLIVSPFLFPLLSPHHSSHIHILLRHSQPPQPQNPSLPFSFSLPLLLFFLSLFLFSLCALASITHSVFHGFFGRPVKLLSALLSIPASFFPLLATALISQLFLLLPLPLLALPPPPPPLLRLPHRRRPPRPPRPSSLPSSTSASPGPSPPQSSVIESTWGLQPLRRSSLPHRRNATPRRRLLPLLRLARGLPLVEHLRPRCGLRRLGLEGLGLRGPDRPHLHSPHAAHALQRRRRHRPLHVLQGRSRRARVRDRRGVRLAVCQLALRRRQGPSRCFGCPCLMWRPSFVELFVT
ncbi:hypothetical protein E2542_SST15992 [Spatholobus suberectus]|nr:hypothetical protein E2542_SST15992 [Spatholobus suberectus]